jgi:hypothetical protein
VVFEKKELDLYRQASEEACLDIFLWFFVGGEGLPPEKLYYDELLRDLREQLDEGGDEPCDADHRDSQEHVLKSQGRLEAWLDTIS